MEDGVDYDIDAMVDALRNTSTYDEFRMKCDLIGIECIITRDEYSHLKSVYDYGVPFNHWQPSHSYAYPSCKTTYRNLQLGSISL